MRGELLHQRSRIVTQAHRITQSDQEPKVSETEAESVAGVSSLLSPLHCHSKQIRLDSLPAFVSCYGQTGPRSGRLSLLLWVCAP
jgi:hypothetical protein